MVKKRFVKLLIILLVVICGSSGLKAQNVVYPVLKLDINNSDNAAENEPGFTPFTLGDSGSQVDGITVEFAGNLDSRRRDVPTGIPFEQLFRDFLFARAGQSITVTLSGLQANQTYEITTWSFDTHSTQTRIANWTANGAFLFTATFDGAQNPPTGEDDYKFTGTAIADENGRIVMEGVFGEGSLADQPFAFMNGLMLSSTEPIKIATNPEPKDESVVQFTGVMLQWQPGAYADSHNVYFGENFDDVNDGTGGTFLGNQADIYFFVGLGLPGDPYPGGLVTGKTYYWRVDEVEADSTVHKGIVWSFSIPSKTAYNPSPANNAKFVGVNVTLEWTAGTNATQHHVYFGDNFQDVQAGTGGTDKGIVKDPSYIPGALEIEKSYYWRVDEFDGANTHKGDVWSFTTAPPGLGTIIREIWENLDGLEVAILTGSADYPSNPSLIDELTEFSTQPNLDNYGGRIYGWLYVPLTGDYTFWLSTDNQGELWLSTDEDPENAQLIVSETSWGAYNNFSRKSSPVALIGGNKYYIMALWKEDDAGDHCQVAWQGAGIPIRQIIQGNYLAPYEPVAAFRPTPSDGSIDVVNNPVLSWKAGKYAASHELYFGTDEDSVRNATKVSPEYKGTRVLGDESYDPGKLELETAYYWRVDEVNSLNPDSPWLGDVWSFTTGKFLTIDDFEDYDAGDNQIWYAWRDGLGYGSIDIPPYSAGNGTGSEVGDGSTDSYTEETIFHGGGQSMPYWYNNNKPDKAKYSEVKKTLTDVRNWTHHGVKALSLWFRGYPAYVGSFTEGPTGTYTMTASGTDITGQADEFHFAYKTLSGPGTIVAKVESVQNTNGWAKAAVMIRETLDPNSAHAMTFVTPENGVVFEYRPATGQDNVSVAGQQTGITAPYWVKIERVLIGNFTAYYSSNGSNWQTLSIPLNIPMSANVYIGLALTSHDAALTCEAVFSNVTISGNVSGQWLHQDIGIQSNDPEPMYVAVANSTGIPAVVYHDDPNAAQIDTWTEWNIDLKDFADKGVVLTDVNSIAIGFGDRNNPQAGGSGKMYFDDIRLYRPRYVPGLGTPLSADLNRNGVVDYGDIEVMSTDWLNQGGNGLWYEYCEGSWNVLPDFDLVSTVKQGVVNNFDITVRNQDDNFGFRFTGKLNVVTAGDYTFYTTSDDGSQLYIDDMLLVDNDGLHGMVEQSGTVNMTAGLHDITVTMFELGDGEGLDVEYEGPGITRQAIPDDVLSLPEPMSDLNQDGIVNFNDYAALAEQWLEEQLWPEW